MELGVVRGNLPAAQRIFFLREHDDGAPFRGFVCQAGQLRGIRQFGLRDPRRRHECHRLPASERDGARLVEQQRVDVAGGLDRLSAHREDVVLHHAVHAGDADRREQSANRRRNQAHEQRDIDGNRRRCPRSGRRDAVEGVGHQRRNGEQKDDRQAGDQDVQRDLVGRLLTLGTLDERNHAIEERLAWVRGDFDFHLIGEHARASGDRAAIPAGLPDDRRTLARDDRLVNGGDAVDDLAVARNDLTCRDNHDIAGAKFRRGNLLDPPAVGQPVCERVGLGLPQRLGLRLPAGLGHRFGERGEEHGEPEPQVDLKLESDPARADRNIPDQEQQHERRSDFDDEDHGILHQRDRIQLQHRILQGATENLRIEQRPRPHELLRDERRLIRPRRRDRPWSGWRW